MIFLARSLCSNFTNIGFILLRIIKTVENINKEVLPME